MFLHRTLRSLFIALLSAIALPAFAQTATDSFQVSITIADDCSIAADNLNFGSETSLASLVDATSNITVTCSVGTAYTVSLDQGDNGTRFMSDGSDTVDYELYLDAGRTNAWGEDIGVDTVGGTGNGAAQILAVYGRVPAQATPDPATYTDQITATVAF
jgi:spore coat protein U-like protein